MDKVEFDRVEFARGWCAWVAFLWVDTDACCDGDGRPVTAAYRDGYVAAERANNQGGDRPTCDDADDAANDYPAS